MGCIKCLLWKSGGLICGPLAQQLLIVINACESIFVSQQQMVAVSRHKERERKVLCCLQQVVDAWWNPTSGTPQHLVNRRSMWVNSFCLNMHVVVGWRRVHFSPFRHEETSIPLLSISSCQMAQNGWTQVHACHRIPPVDILILFFPSQTSTKYEHISKTWCAWKNMKTFLKSAYKYV